MHQPSLFPVLEVRDGGAAMVQPVPYSRPRLVHRALKLLESEMRQADVLTSPQAVRDYLRLLLGDRPHEVFAVVFLDAQHRVIKSLEMFRGTLTQICAACMRNYFRSYQRIRTAEQLTWPVGRASLVLGARQLVRGSERCHTLLC